MVISEQKYLNKSDDELISGASYIGAPKSDTVMYVSKKIDYQLRKLADVQNCLVFVEKNCTIPDEIVEKNTIVLSENPQLSYVKYVEQLEQKRLKEEATYGFKYICGSYISETASVSTDAYIEPGCRIGHGVVIGKKARILSGTIISNAVIGDNFMSNEYAVIGANGFTMADDKKGNKVRIPSLGKVIIGDNVEVGAHDNISRGSAGDTKLSDNVKLDAFVHVGHDAILHKNVEVTAGVIIGGFDEIGDSTFIGLNAILRNRIIIGSNVIIGMGAVVTKSVENGITVIGNPAADIEKKRSLG